MQVALTSQGRSASALSGAISGSGTVTVEYIRVAGLDPRVFDAAIRASDNGQATDDARLRQIIEPVLSGGALTVKSAQIPFSFVDGRLRVGATTLDGDGARAIVSGGYDIPADQADIRATLVSTAVSQASSRPELQLFVAGSPDALHRAVDVSSLSSWLAVRAIDRETRRLDSIERGEAPATSASLPSPGAGAAGSEAPAVDPPIAEVPAPARHVPPKPKFISPRPAAATPSPSAPILSQQLAPLPPPIEIRPAPGPAPRAPRPKPPLVLTPPAATPLR
jgi:large subunit ribosomal protein L24